MSKKLKCEFKFDHLNVIAKCKNINEYGEMIDLELVFTDEEGCVIEDEALPVPASAMDDIEDIACEMLYTAKFFPDSYEEMYE